MKKAKDKKKVTKTKKPKKKLTFIEAHNRAYRAYSKASGIMLWASIFNVFGVILPIVQYAISGNLVAKFVEGSYFGLKLGVSTYQFGFAFAGQSLICRFLEIANVGIGGTVESVLPTYAFYLISIISSIVIAGIVSYLSVLARTGKKWALLTNSIVYIIDTLLIIPCYFLGEDMQNIWILIGMHIIILVFVFLSIFEYYHLMELEKVFNKEKENIKIKPAPKVVNQNNKKKEEKKLENEINDVFNNEEKKIEEPQNPLFNVIIEDTKDVKKEGTKNGTKQK